MRRCHALRAAGGSAHTPPHTSGRVQQHPVSLVNREEVKEGEREADQESFHITSAAAAADRLGGFHHVGMRIWTRAPQLTLNNLLTRQ